MAITDFQRTLIQCIAQNRRESGESYLAGGAALNFALDAPRLSDDLNLFHDSREAVRWAVDADERALHNEGYVVSLEIDRETFVEALVSKGGIHSRIQWAQDSAFRFFPLVDHPQLCLTLHPFDLATNKVLALVGRAVPRDWVDVIVCDSRLQPFGCLVWTAAGKDPGLSPTFILEQAARSVRYTEIELAEVSFEGERPTAASLSLAWRRIMEEARAITATLPWQHVGECLLDRQGELLRLDPPSLVRAVAEDAIYYHPGSLYGAFPKIVAPSLSFQSQP